MENEYPCAECVREKQCRHTMKYKKCKSFVKWFRERWGNIRKHFGVKCVNSTLEEKE